MHSETLRNSWVKVAQEVMNCEAEAILQASSRLDESLSIATELIVRSTGKTVVVGLGKSGHVAHKMVASLCSIGTPSVFLHPVEALHGDLGIYAADDPTILISKSGTTPELLRLVPVLREFGSPLIGILGCTTSPLAKALDVVLDGSVRQEADPHGLAPTTSSTVAMALGDALTVALMKARNFTEADFGRFHPGGHIGVTLRTEVRDVMHKGEQVAWVAPGDSVKHLAIAMTRRPLGAACVIFPDKQLVGLITDGDLRRAFQEHDDIRLLTASEIMTGSPVTVSPDVNLRNALRMMEDRPSQISVLPVVDPADGRVLGLIRLHDIYDPEDRFAASRLNADVVSVRE